MTIVQWWGGSHIKYEPHNMFRRAKGAYMPVLSESVLSVSVHIHCIWIAHSKCERVVHGGLWGAARQNELFGNREKMDIKL